MVAYNVGGAFFVLFFFSFSRNIEYRYNKCTRMK